jgi:SAM-dependent methyltransferase
MLKTIKKFPVIAAVLFTLISVVPARAQNSRGSRFAVLSCMHLGISSALEFESAVQKINQYKPDFVIFLGGMVEPVREKSVDSLWQIYDRITAQLNVPVYNVPGDCQLWPLKFPAEKTLAMQKCFEKRYPKRYFSFEKNGDLFIFLDSNDLPLLKPETPSAKKQIEFLIKTLENASRYKNVFISMDESPWFTNEDKWFDLIHPLINKKVNCVLGAKIHTLDFKKVDEVAYISSGAASLNPIKRQNALFNHFLIIDTTSDPLSIQAVPVGFTLPTMLSKGSPNKNISTYPDYLLAQEYFKAGVLDSFERKIILDQKKIILAMKIRPGMTIADIGAGSGLFSFPFSEAVGPKGKVFATDIDARMIKTISERIKNSGEFSNIFPVKVKSEGVDPFYGEHSFDIMFLGGVYDGLLDPQEYFTRLRPYLVKDSGRLFIIQLKNTADFNEMEFLDFKKTVGLLYAQGAKSPLFKRLSPEVRSFVNTWNGEAVPDGIRRKITDDLNNILPDRLFWNELFEYASANRKIKGQTILIEDMVDPLDARLAKWIIPDLEEKKVFDPRVPTVAPADFNELKKLNRILISGILKTDIFYWTTTRRLSPEKNAIIDKLSLAGYELAADHDFLPMHCFLEFKRKE